MCPLFLSIFQPSMALLLDRALYMVFLMPCRLISIYLPPYYSPIRALDGIQITQSAYCSVRSARAII